MQEQAAAGEYIRAVVPDRQIEGLIFTPAMPSRTTVPPTVSASRRYSSSGSMMATWTPWYRLRRTSNFTK